MKIVGYIEFDESLRVPDECLGYQFPIMVDSFAGNLFTPIKGVVGAPPVSSGDVDLEEPITDLKLDLEIEWGRFIGNNTSQLHAFKIEFNINESDGGKFKECANKLYEGLAKWITRFKANLSAFGQSVNTPTSFKNRKDFEKGMYDIMYWNGSRLWHPYDLISTGNLIVRFEKITLREFEQVLRLTSENRQPILELRLLDEARLALIKQDFRKSVLDSATAFELCLTNQLKRKLKVDQPLLDEILKSNNSIGKKRKLLSVINEALPTKYNYEQDIEVLRNRAIHIGTEPTEDEARNALKISREIVKDLCIDRFE